MLLPSEKRREKGTATTRCAWQAAIALTAILAQGQSAAPSDNHAQIALRATGIERGLALVVDHDLRLAADLADDSRWLVHLLTPDAGAVGALRDEALRRRLGGRVVIDALATDRHLPHPDRFVNLIVVDRDALGDAAPSRDEMSRVLSARGAIYEKQSGRWSVKKPAADERLDGWTHRWYDASGNCVSHDRVAAVPQSVQWQHGPAMEDGTADGKLPRIADGRWVTIDTSSGDLVCRDAGNGTLLWRKSYQLSPRDDMAIAAGRIHFYYDADAKPDARRREQPTSGPLVAADMATGEIVKTYDEGLPAGTAKRIAYQDTDENRPREETPVPWFIVADDVVVQAYEHQLLVLDRASGRRRFVKALDDATWFSPIVAGERLIAAEATWPARRGRHDGSGNVRAVAAFALADGEPLWRNDSVHPQREIDDRQRRYFSRAEFKPMSAAGDRVLLHTSSYQFRQGGGIALLDARDGRELWRVSFDPKQRYDQGSQRAVLRGGEVVLMDGMGALRYDLETGKPLGDELNDKLGLKRIVRGNGACTSSRATVDWLICNAYLYIGPDGQPQARFGARGACGQGVIPAHGLVFVPPTPCDCGDYIRGHAALSPTAAGHEIAAERLVKGPAYGHVESPSADGRDAWTTFLGDPQRRSASATKLPDELQLGFQRQAIELRRDALDADRRDSEWHIGALSAPVVGDGLVVVAAPEAHGVLAFDAQSGEPRWQFAAGGKVDSPPTLAGGYAVCGCDDGSIYALRAADGELAWRFRAAPRDGLSMHHGHLASAFPLPGSVLVLGDAVIAVAGHHTDLGGLHAWVLDLRTGEPRAQSVIGADQPRVVTNGVVVADSDERGIWIGQQLHLSLALEDLPANMHTGPKPPIAFDRGGTRMRFRTDHGRGGSTHPWKQAMTIPSRNRLTRGHRLVAAGETTFGLVDLEPHRWKSPLVWRTPTADETAQTAWSLAGEQLGEPMAYGALLVADEKLFIGGGSRDGERGVLHVVDAASGKLLRTLELPARVAECGLAAAGGKVYVACEDGTLVCWGQTNPKRQ